MTEAKYSSEKPPQVVGNNALENTVFGSSQGFRNPPNCFLLGGNTGIDRGVNIQHYRGMVKDGWWQSDATLEQYFDTSTLLNEINPKPICPSHGCYFLREGNECLYQ